MIWQACANAVRSAALSGGARAEAAVGLHAGDAGEHGSAAVFQTVDFGAQRRVVKRWQGDGAR